jgi:predicted transcriptional regulator
MERRKAGSADDGRAALAAALDQARREDGLSQHALARVLGSSQANVSKLLRGQHKPRPNLAKAVQTYLAARHQGDMEPSEVWMRRLLSACERSKAFRDIVDAALLLVNENE